MTTTALLREIHRYRRHLRDLQNEIDLGPRVMKAHEAKLAAAEADHKATLEALKMLKVKVKEDEVSLKTTEANLAKYEAQVHSAGSKKEFDAKHHEIAHAKEQKSQFEDAILTGMAEIEEKTAALPAVEKLWADAQAEFAQYKIDAKERLERMIADLATTKESLVAAEAQLPATMKGQYDRLVKSYGPDGLAGVNGRSCGQCRMSVTEAQRVVLAGGGFVCCSTCGRGLYLLEGG